MAANNAIETFRVYNGVSRVGVAFKIGGTSLGVPSLALLVAWPLLGIGVCSLFLLVPGGLIGLILAVLVGVFALFVELWLILWVRRIDMLAPAPAIIGEAALAKVVEDSFGEPWVTNFDAPDEVEIDWDATDLSPGWVKNF